MHPPSSQPRRPSPKRLVTPVAAMALALAMVAPGVAHTPLVSTVPAQGRTVAHLPRTVTLTFGQPITAVTAVRVTHAATGRNRAVRARLNSRNRAQVLVATSGDRVGRYTVAWRVVMADGHPLGGRFTFRVSR